MLGSLVVWRAAFPHFLTRVARTAEVDERMRNSQPNMRVREILIDIVQARRCVVE